MPRDGCGFLRPLAFTVPVEQLHWLIYCPLWPWFTLCVAIFAAKFAAMSSLVTLAFQALAGWLFSLEQTQIDELYIYKFQALVGWLGLLNLATANDCTKPADVTSPGGSCLPFEWLLS